MTNQTKDLKGAKVIQTELYPKEESVLVNTVAQRVVGAYNKHGSQYRDARDTYGDWLNRPAPTRFSGSTSRYGLDYRPETTAAINRHYDTVNRLGEAAKEAGQRVKELVLQEIPLEERIGLELYFDSLHPVALFAPQRTSRQYTLDLDRPDSYKLAYFIEKPVFWRWGKKKVKHELRIPVSLS